MRQRRPFEGKEQARTLAAWRRERSRLAADRARIQRLTDARNADLEADRLADEEQDRYDDRD